MTAEVDGDAVNSLVAELRALAPSHIVVGARRIDERDETTLVGEECAAVRAAGPLRRREFASGRTLLRQLIGRGIAIPVGDNRAPVLPPEVRGSLAHDDQFVIAAISRDPRVLSIGIDIEPRDVLEPRLVPMILRDDELHLDAHLAFTLKEAAYKAWSSLGGRTLELHDVRVSVTGSLFRAEIVADDTVVEGSFGTAARRWIALVVT